MDLQTGTLYAGLLTSLGISLLAIPSIVKVAKAKGLYGTDREMDSKSKRVPTLGGLAIFAGVTISLSLYIDITALPELPYFMAGALVLFFIGLKDDILVTAPIWKLLGQILVAALIAMPCGLIIQDPGSFIGLEASSNVVEILLTILVIIAVINSINLIDGIDGLASGIGILSFVLFATVFYKGGMHEWALLAMILCGSLAGFAWYNVFSRRNKILMGDTGSLLLGLFIALMTIRFLNLEQAYIWKWQINNPLAFMLAVLIIPLFDTLRIIFVRLLRGQSPLHADRKHIHYRLIDSGLTHIQATGILLGINLAMIVIALITARLGEIPAILIIMILAAGLSLAPGFHLNRKKNSS
jgi:UDP-N-acetylmuramyl pentapeptide phosphotransferase/UDP-N-acetylglucosamine-1-phosphate transferase